MLATVDVNKYNEHLKEFAMLPGYISTPRRTQLESRALYKNTAPTTQVSFSGLFSIENLRGNFGSGGRGLCLLAW